MCVCMLVYVYVNSVACAYVHHWLICCLCRREGLMEFFLSTQFFICTWICQTYKVNIQTILNECESNIACNITQGVLVCFPVSFTLQFEVLWLSAANSPWLGVGRGHCHWDSNLQAEGGNSWAHAEDSWTGSSSGNSSVSIWSLWTNCWWATKEFIIWSGWALPSSTNFSISFPITAELVMTISVLSITCGTLWLELTSLPELSAIGVLLVMLTSCPLLLWTVSCTACWGCWSPIQMLHVNVLVPLHMKRKQPCTIHYSDTLYCDRSYIDIPAVYTCFRKGLTITWFKVYWRHCKERSMARQSLCIRNVKE